MEGDRDRERERDRERILALELELRNLRELGAEQRSADRNSNDLTYKQLLAQLTTLATAADKFALAAFTEKLDTRVETIEKVINDPIKGWIPRGELQALLNNVLAGQDTMKQGVGRIEQNFTALSAEWSAEEADQKTAAEQKEKRRNLWLAAAGVLVAALVGVPAFIGVFKSSPTPKPEIIYLPATTTTIPTQGR